MAKHVAWLLDFDSFSLIQALAAEDEAPSLPHAAGSFQKAGGALAGTEEYEHPQPSDERVWGNRNPGADRSSIDQLRWEEQLAASRTVKDCMSSKSLLQNCFRLH